MNHLFSARALHRALACALSTTLVTSSLVACGGPADATHDTSFGEAKSAATYDGETVLRGVFFGRGPVGAILPEMWGDGVTIGDVAHGADSRTLADEIDRYGATMCERGCSDATREGLTSAAERLRGGEKDPVELAARDSTFTRVRGPAADASINALVASLESSDPAFVESFGVDMQSGDPLRVDAAFSEAGRRLVAAATALSHETGGVLGVRGASPDKVKSTDDVVYDNTIVIVYVILLVPTAVAPAAVAGAGLERDMLIASLSTRLRGG